MHCLRFQTTIHLFQQMHIELSVCTNNETIIKALIVFSEGIFDGETLIGYSNTKPTSRIVLPFRTPKTIAYDIHLKVYFTYSAPFAATNLLINRFNSDSRWIWTQSTISCIRIDASTTEIRHVCHFGKIRCGKSAIGANRIWWEHKQLCGIQIEWEIPTHLLVDKSGTFK